MDEKRVCSICGAILSENEGRVFTDELLCKTCFEDNTTVCDYCGQRIWCDDTEGDSHTTLCGRCFENHYTYCEDCGRLLLYDAAYYFDGDDEEYPYCRTCFEKRTNRAIKSYNYKPEPIFYGSGDFYFGVELEIDKGGEDNDNARELLDIGNHEKNHIYCKHDGSIYNGFEVISHPMTLSYHKDKMPWYELMNSALGLGYKSHNTETCGLHCHVNRNGFGETEEEQDAAIGRVVYFVEKHWNELVKFSRRKEANLNRWAARYSTISNTAKETYTKAKGKCSNNRYLAINLTNSSTIEFRLFKGTLRYETFLATLELVKHICYLASQLFDEDFEKMSWLDFVQTIDADEMPELIEYLKSKRLYVNEITETSEEE